MRKTNRSLVMFRVTSKSIHQDKLGEEIVKLRNWVLGAILPGIMNELFEDISTEVIVIEAMKVLELTPGLEVVDIE